jgi:undecaprenyl-diphosphatase
MSVFQALVLGIVQGATEFLPISSSGHLVLVPWFLGWDLDLQAAFIFDVLVQWGTILAVVIYFRRDLFAILRGWLLGLFQGQPFSDPEAKLGWLLILASLPAVVLGLGLKSIVESTFAQPEAVSGFLLFTAALLLASERLRRSTRTLDALTGLDAFLIGVAQALALFPGVSRSGATMAGGITRGLNRIDAARFSFLMAVPVMLGAGSIALLDLAQSPSASTQLAPLAVGFVAAALVGLASIHFLLGYIKRHPLTIFALYCLVLGMGGLLRNAFAA